ncbi:MAG: asparagine synthase (glutamine-hydrolyzing), partial [Endomicrobia bacterium]|nr:asparagine synthase (glutamine-hydrolyzing) [Endomicrobiia bacterium]
MCGIVGVCIFNNAEVEVACLKKMANVISHRGPDEEGFYISKKFNIDTKKYIQVGLGIRRLAIIDLITGSQPIHNEDKTIYVILNGEIYNFLSLREELIKKGHSFYTKSDTEVLVHLYEEEGVKLVDKLRGMYAFALWDEKNKSLFLVRDRVGKKPLYYTLQNGNLIFASEIKSILQYLDKLPEINYEAIDYFLTYQYIPQPITIYKDIYKLPPASYMVFDKYGNYKISRYWELDFRKKSNISFEEAKQKLKEILTEATKLRLISDVPLGAFLSGGHDSSIIVGLMAENSSKVKTFSVGFKERDFSELKYARIVAKHFDTEHTEIIVEPNMTEILPKLIWYYDQPFADTSMIPSYYVSNVTRQYVKVALNGDGGDENFCGYLRYPAVKLSSLLPFEVLGSRFYKNLGSVIPLVETTSAKHKLRYFRRFFTVLGEPLAVRNVLWHCFFTNELKNFIYSNFMKEVTKGNNVYNYLVNTFYSAKANDIIDRISYTDINTYLPEDLLVKMDIASMANSLEARSPFLDYKLLEFTASIPSSW